MNNEEPLQRVPEGGPLRHEVGGPGRAEALRDALAEDLPLLAGLRGRHVVSLQDFDAPTTVQLLRLAARFEAGDVPRPCPLSGRILCNAFFDRSHGQTRLSLSSAWLRLGGAVLDLDPAVTDFANRHPHPDEAAELCSANGDVAVVRTADGEALQQMLGYFRIPVVNAGNGGDENPTHGLADLYTVFKWRPDLVVPAPGQRGLQIGIFGDPSYTRTIRSFLLALTRFPHAVERVVFFERVPDPFSPGQRQELEAAGLKVATASELCGGGLTNRECFSRVIPDLDVIYVHQLIVRPGPRMNIVRGLGMLKPNAMVLCPEIPTPEFGELVNNTVHNAYFAQASGAGFLRMAVFCAVMGSLAG